MNKIIFSLFCCLLACLISLAGFAQSAPGMTTQPAEMAEGLRSSGKIYVVVLVMVTILTGLFIYLIRLERKISHWEKNGQN